MRKTVKARQVSYLTIEYHDSMNIVNPTTTFLQKTPFVKLFMTFAAGILLQFHSGIPLPAILFLLASALLLRLFARWQSRALWHSLPLLLLVLAAGMAACFFRDVRRQQQFIGQQYSGKGVVKIRLAEPLVEKTNTWKADAEVQALIMNDTLYEVMGKVIVYFKKQVQHPVLDYGSELLVTAPLQPIRNSGNPGAFDYERQCLFRGITHQVFLDSGDYVIQTGAVKDGVQENIFHMQAQLVSSLRRYVPGEKEKGVAEALLIGYRNDLDKSLVEAYASTGTIHIIAISGLHLGMIYMILLFLLRPLERSRVGRMVKVLLILAVLWLFTLLAGGAPSIMRSAIMFSCILLAQTLHRNSSIYNTLAASAFVLLCINPFYLWDVGFQLSYAAVLSIVVFMKPVYGLLTIKNRWIDYLWKLNAVTLSAQILTLPVILFHFHQFPTLFLLTNLVAVPLSSLILGAELLLVAISWWSAAAGLLGKLISLLIALMNGFVERMGGLPFAVFDYLQMNIVECVCLYAVIIAAATGWLRRHKKAWMLALAFGCMFGGLRLYSAVLRQQQQQVVVYNVPKQRAIDFVDVDRYVFIGDSSLRKKGFLQNFHLKPARIVMGTHERMPAGFETHRPFYNWLGRTVLVLDSNLQFEHGFSQPPAVHLLVLGRKARPQWGVLTRQFAIAQVVADGSASAWACRRWQRECDSLHIPFHSVAEKGAFVLTCKP
jgi:competence protein ComEC